MAVMPRQPRIHNSQPAYRALMSYWLRHITCVINTALPGHPFLWMHRVVGDIAASQRPGSPYLRPNLLKRVLPEMRTNPHGEPGPQGNPDLLADRGVIRIDMSFGC